MNLAPRTANPGSVKSDAWLAPLALRWNRSLRQFLTSFVVPNWTKTRRARHSPLSGDLRSPLETRQAISQIVRIATCERGDRLIISPSTRKRRHHVGVIARVGSVHLQRQQPAGSCLVRLDHRRVARHRARQHLSGAIVARCLGCQLGVQHIAAGALDGGQRKLN